jgi:hypothetical protein
MDAVLPLLPRDLERAERLLLPTLLTYFEPLAACRVIVPDDAVEPMAARLRHPAITVIPETSVVPELNWHVRLDESDPGSTKGLRGWFVQQMLKLSAARIVETPFYLTLDADVLCCRRIAYDDLIKSGRALTVVSQTGDKSHERWYERSAAVLGMPRSTRTHAVTPVALSREAVLKLLAFFEERLHPNQLRAEALLLGHFPWTEYSLYFTFLEQTGQFDIHHLATHDRLSGNNVWGGSDPNSWNPALSFSPQGKLFSVLQSHTVTDIDSVVSKVRSYFQMAGAVPPL